MVGLTSMTVTLLQPVLVTTARLFTSSMATPPGEAAVPFDVAVILQLAKGISSRTVKSATFELTLALLATSSAKWRGPVKTPGGNVTSSSWLPFSVTVAPRVVTSMASRRTFDALEKPEPKICTGPTEAGDAPNVIFTAGLIFAFIVILALPASIAGVTTRSMFRVLIFPTCPSWKKERLSLPELTASATLLMESTTRAPGKFTVIAAVAWSGVKLTVALPVWPVGMMASRCEAEGSMRETWLNCGFGLNETAVLVKGWKATVVAPSSGGPVVTEPVAPANRVRKLTDSLWGSM